MPTNKYPKYPVIVECSNCSTQYEMNKSTYKAAPNTECKEGGMTLVLSNLDSIIEDEIEIITKSKG